MNRLFTVRIFCTTILVIGFTAWASAAASARHVVTNNDNFPNENTITIYAASGTADAAKLTELTTLSTGGVGDGDGYLEGQQQAFVLVGKTKCLFIGDAGSADVAAIDVGTRRLVGNFRGSFQKDLSNQFGISLLPSSDGTLLYAAYRERAFGFASSIATFTIEAGCKLTFVDDTIGFGSQGGGIEGMAAHGDILVVGYGDGSIESFHISGTTLTSNNDKQNATGFTSHNNGLGPGSVQITADGRFAVFGDVVSNIEGEFTEIEVSDISSGKLTATVDYGGAHHANGDLGPGLSSNSAILSSDESHIYVSNPFSGQVTALNFDAANGVVTFGCISDPLSGFTNAFPAMGQIAASGATAKGDVLWVAEDGNGGSSSIGIVRFVPEGSSCSLTESAHSPAEDAHSIILKSLSAF